MEAQAITRKQKFLALYEHFTSAQQKWRISNEEGPKGEDPLGTEYYKVAKELHIYSKKLVKEKYALQFPVSNDPGIFIRKTSEAFAIGFKDDSKRWDIPDPEEIYIGVR